MQTLTTTFAKKLGVKSKFYFNDVLKDGRRSIKVYGWQRHHYEELAKLLESAGCKTKIVEFRNSRYDGYHCWWGRTRDTVIRLHVTESLK